MKAISIGKKKFTAKDQKDFAKISHDYNPIHTDPIISRRLVSGRQIVHGINILLTALDYLFKKKFSFEFDTIHCIFYSPVNIDEHVEFIKKHKENSVIVEIKNKYRLRSKIILEKKYDKNRKEEIYTKNSIKKIKKINIKKNFANFTKTKKNYDLNLNNFYLSKKYKNLNKVFKTLEIKTIISLSYFVGMICPGLNSMLSSLEINFHNKLKNNKNIRFFIKKYDKRFNLYLIKFSNNISGQLKAFIHRGIVSQPSIEKIQRKIKSREFSETNSLIIGGSRGLGELTAKILTSGNGNVTLTYFNGKNDAKKIRRSIKSKTGQSCKIENLDIFDKNFGTKVKKYVKFNFIFYYATPKIGTKENEESSNVRFKKFHSFYVEKFKILCEKLEKNTKRKILVFFPSTIAIKEPKNFSTEYVRAKLIAESMIKKLNKKFNKIKILSVRLPRLKTDQTVGIISNFKNENVKIMLPIIKSMIKNKKI